LKATLEPFVQNQISNYEKLKDLESSKFIVFLSSSGEITLNILLRIEKERKTFAVKLDSKTLERISEPDFDFGSLDYFDLTKKIKKDLRRPDSVSTIAYIFDDLSEMP
jgi:hypothetical protein